MTDDEKATLFCSLALLLERALLSGVCMPNATDKEARMIYQEQRDNCIRLGFKAIDRKEEKERQ